jgi:hypothetical protein
MTMQHIARSFNVSLSVRHPDIDPAKISATLARNEKGTGPTLFGTRAAHDEDRSGCG